MPEDRKCLSLWVFLELKGSRSGELRPQQEFGKGELEPRVLSLKLRSLQDFKGHMPMPAYISGWVPGLARDQEVTS